MTPAEKAGRSTCAGRPTTAVRDWVIDPSTFDVWVGGDSAAELGTTFEVTKG